MNIFDDIALVRSEFDDSWTLESLEAVERLEVLRQRYAALAPDWTEAPAWAQWYTADIDGYLHWHEREPVFGSVDWVQTGHRDQRGYSKLPIGIDSRLCKWQRPEVAP